ncbi:MAG: hypothetical protein AAF380_00425 [Bacteroidota bacterium]
MQKLLAILLPLSFCYYAHGAQATEEDHTGTLKINYNRDFRIIISNVPHDIDIKDLITKVQQAYPEKNNLKNPKNVVLMYHGAILEQNEKLSRYVKLPDLLQGACTIWLVSKKTRGMS